MTGTALTNPRPTSVGFNNTMPGVELPKAPPTRVRRLIFWLFLLGFCLFGGLGTWAALVPMRSAIVAPGSFHVVGERLTVQHYDGGILQEINVKEGDIIQKGDVLLRLDGTNSRSTLSILNNQLAAALSTEARLNAEFQGQDEMVISDELARLVALNPEFNELLVSQRSLFMSNQQMFNGRIEILKTRMSQLQARMEGADERVFSLEEQLAFVQEQLNDIDTLHTKGLVTKTQLLTRRRDESNMLGQIALAESSRQSVMEQMGETEERLLQVRRDWVLSVASERQVLKERIFEIRQRLSANQAMADRLVIRAPQTARVVGLQVNTIGEVIERGNVLMELVPLDSDYVVQTRVRPDDIDQVQEGGEARLRLTAYNFRTTPPVLGKVVHVSADSFVDEMTGAPFYRVDVVINDGELEKLPNNVEVLPGMNAQVMLTTGEQTLADYLFTPVLGGLETALRENN